jgi:hypothetical protein
MHQHEKTQQPPTHKEGDERVYLVVQGMDTFIVTWKMVRMDQETTQKPMGEIDQFEVIMVQISTKELYRLHVSIMQ